MKYIRTKDGIYEIKDNCVLGIKLTWWQLESVSKNKGHFYIDGHIICEKVADTIEELCDELVFEWHRSSISHDNDTWHLYHEISLKEEIENAMSDGFRADMEDVKNIYGAIWADEGLIYVAKMNKKGELELL